MLKARIRGLVLDRQHRVLVDEQGLAPELVCEWPERPLRAFLAFARETLGLELPSPAGSVKPADGRGPRDFLFLVEDALAAAPGLRWLHLAQAAENDWLWRAYVEMALAGWEPPTREIVACAFGAGAEMTSCLAHLVTSGSKRVTTSWPPILEHDGYALPTPGMIWIVTDGFGVPRCAIRTVMVEQVRFGDVDAEAAALEGEGDLTLEDWREAHRGFFRSEAERTGLAFGDDEMVLIERFTVLQLIGRVDAE